MTKIYTLTKAVAITALCLGLNQVNAQNQTSVSPSNACGNIVENFNAGTGGYTSRSVYGANTDFPFYYNSSLGYWTEMGEVGNERTVATITPRNVSIVSRAYPSPATGGFFDVGFRYVVPQASVDRFNVALIRLTTTGGVTVPETVAESKDVNTGFFRPFSAFTTEGPTAYNDPRPAGTPGTSAPNPLLTGESGKVCIRLTDVDITVGPNITYRVEITYDIRSGGTFTVFDDLTLNPNPVGENPPPTLPVNFVGLYAVRMDNNTVNVKWDVAYERDVKEYQIERSDNGTTFKTIGSVPSNGKSVYSFIDGGAGAGTVLYRIKNLDADGKSKYSTILRLKGVNSYGNTLRMYPSPAQAQATVEHKQLPANANITISTIDGRILKAIKPSPGASHTPVDLSGMAAGTYIIRLNDGKGKVETLKFVKQ